MIIQTRALRKKTHADMIFLIMENFCNGVENTDGIATNNLRVKLKK